MNLTILEQYIDNRIKILNEEKEIIFSNFKQIEVAKGTILLQKDSVCKYIYFINKGVLRTYFINKEGYETTRLICFESMFCNSLASFVKQTPSFEYLEALEDCELLSISYDDFYKLLNVSQGIERIYRMVLEEVEVLNTWRLESLISLDAKQRYDMLCKIYPDLVKRVSNKIIASYIAIKPETLSRIKSK